MPVQNCEVIKLIEQLAPRYIAAEWDNSGLQIGSLKSYTEHVLITLDVDEKVVKEAIDLGANLIISHHPILMKGIKRIDLSNNTGHLISMLLKNDITVYAAHTNLDSVIGGVSDILADKVELKDVDVLYELGRDQYVKLVVFVPEGHQDAVRQALSLAGAGWIGNYSDCTFQTVGMGTFCPREGTNPFIGKKGQIEKVREIRLETIVHEKKLHAVIDSMIKVHPYEEVAYDIYPLKEPNEIYGFGRIGVLRKPLKFKRFIEKAKEKLGLKYVRCGGDPNRIISKVAVCGGSGSELWETALEKQADVYLTGDIKYHIANDMLASDLAFVDAGHFYTELPVLELIFKCLEEGLNRGDTRTGLTISKCNRDPFEYL